MYTPAGISSRSRTSPVEEIEPASSRSLHLPTWRAELSVHPGNSGDEAVGLDRAKNEPVLGINFDQFRFRSARPRVLPDRTDSFISATAGAGMVASARPVFGSIFWNSTVRRSETGAGRRRRFLHRSNMNSPRFIFPLDGSNPQLHLAWRANQRLCPSKVTPWTRSAPGKGPYSLTISAFDRFMLPS